MDLYFELKNTYIFYHFLNFEGNLKFYNSQRISLYFNREKSVERTPEILSDT